jgi:hypothetical protein
MKTEYLLIIIIIFVLIGLYKVIDLEFFANDTNKLPGTLQYYITLPDAINSNAYENRIPSCIEYCKALNKNEKDINTCTDYCVQNSGFMPSVNYQYPDKSLLIQML